MCITTTCTCTTSTFPARQGYRRSGLIGDYYYDETVGAIPPLTTATIEIAGVEYIIERETVFCDRFEGDADRVGVDTLGIKPRPWPSSSSADIRFESGEGGDGVT